MPNTETRETQENEASSCLGENREAKSLALIPHRMWRCSGAISTRMCIAASGSDRSRAPLECAGALEAYVPECLGILIG